MESLSDEVGIKALAMGRFKGTSVIPSVGEHNWISGWPQTARERRRQGRL